MRIEIASGLATGKTTLAKALARHGYNAVLEDLDKNPYFENFYNDMPGYAYPFQLSFVCSKYADIKSCENSAKISVTDYALVNGRAYSAINFEDRPDAMAALDMAYDQIEKDLGRADLILYLDCPIETQQSRIITRGRDSEQDVPSEYLKAYNDTLSALLKREAEKGIPILTIKDNAITGMEFDQHIDQIHQDISSFLEAID